MYSIEYTSYCWSLLTPAVLSGCFGELQGLHHNFSFLLIWLSWVINLYEFSELLHFRYGTQRNVVRQGCTSCIKINFTDGQVLFLGIHSTFDLLKLAKYCHGFVNISNGVRAMLKFESFLLCNCTTLCSLHFVLQGYVINQCRFSHVFRFTYQ